MSISGRLVAAGAIAGLFLAGCGYDDTPLPEKPEAATASSPPDCATPDESGIDPVASYDPGDGVPTGPKIDEILARKRLIVGVSADTFLMGSENPELGNRIEGFDIEVAKAVGRALFGNDFETGKSLELRVITASQRIPLLEDGTLDLVIRNFTINSQRWGCIAFSAEYYHSGQKVLVGASLADGDEANGEYLDPSDLAGLRVCAPKGSTSLDNIQTAEPEVLVEPAVNHTGCLVKFQRGEVDAITGDDTVLAGLAAQDPYAVVPEQEPLSDEPYGIGVNKDDLDLVRFVNYVLEEMRADQSWRDAYQRWLQPVLDPERDDNVIQPTPVYGR